jgi:hypothetical protein
VAATLHDFLQPQVILDVVSRVKKGQGRLGRWLGLHYTGYDDDSNVLTGASMQESAVRHGTYRIFDRTRTVAQGRAPGTGPAWIAPQPIGEVNFTVARFHEKIRLDFEELGNLSPVIGPNSQVDPGGQDYLTRQAGFLAQRFNNAMEIMLAGMIRGTWYMKNVGENWIPVLTAPAAGTPYVTVNHQIPAGHLAQLDMLGAGSIIGTTWSNAAAPIISADLPEMMEAYAQATGMVITDAWCNPTTWGYIINNTEVKNTAGSAQQPFEQYKFAEREDYPEWVAVLRGMPTIRWHIISEYIVADGGTDPSYTAGTGTLTPIIPANTVLFTPPPDPEWVDGIWYGEYISENPGQPAVKKPAYWFWHEWITQPTAVELIGLMNAIPRLRIPKALVAPTVIF